MNEVTKALKERKSCKSYSGRHVEKELLDEIIACGLNAPTGRNLQTPHLVSVTDEETVSELSRLNAAVFGMNIDPFYGAKDVIVVLAKKEGTYIYDGSLAAGNILNAAYSLGVSACWIHRAKEVFASDEGKALLSKWGLEGEYEGIAFCILGYAKEEKAKTEIKSGRVTYID